jgi:alpha-N-arabinofuranosidase
VPYLKVAAVTGEGGGLSIFLFNRDLKRDMQVDVEARGFGRFVVSQAIELRHDDLHATNTKDAPERVKPAPLQEATVEGGLLRAHLRPASWNVIDLSVH